MVESWNNGHHNLHADITAIVNSFDAKKDNRYNHRHTSNLDPDSGVGTGTSTSSINIPLLLPTPSNTQLLHKCFLQHSYNTPSQQIQRNTLTCLMPLGEVDNPSPHTNSHQLTGYHERQINHPMIPYARRSYVQPVLGDPIQQHTSAPWKLISELHARPYPVKTQESSTNCNKISDHQASLTNRLPILLQRSHSVAHRPMYAATLSVRRHSDSSLHTTTLSRFSPTLDNFNEDDKEENYVDSEPLNYITSNQYRVAKDKSMTNQRQHIEVQPNIGKLQKKLWKRNNTVIKGQRLSVCKRSLTHSSDASSDDSDTAKSKFKPQRRVSSYHPPRRTLVVKPARRKTTDALPSRDLLVENANLRTANAEQSSSLPDQNSVNPHNEHIAAASEGDNEESEHNSGKYSRVRHICTFGILFI